MTPDLKELRRLAEAARSGPGECSCDMAYGHHDTTCPARACEALREELSPATVLALLDALEAAQKERDHLKLIQCNAEFRTVAALTAERDRLAAEVAILKELHAEETVAGVDLQTELRAKCERLRERRDKDVHTLKASLAAAVALLRDYEQAHAHTSVVTKDWHGRRHAFLAQHQHPPEGGAKKCPTCGRSAPQRSSDPGGVCNYGFGSNCADVFHDTHPPKGPASEGRQET